MKTLADALKRTPQGRLIFARLHKGLHGPELLGAKKKKKNIFQKIGKYTHKVTGSIAKVAAGLVGIPPGAIDALAKADPTAHKSLVSNLVNSAAGKKAENIIQSQQANAANPAPGSGILANIKPAYIVAGAAGLVAIVFITTSKKKRG